MLRTTLERQLPHGVADLYFEEAAHKTALETRLRMTFDAWSYSEVIPPTFEYYEALAAETGPQVRQEIYRFADRDGRMLALRADPTIPIARLVGAKLYTRPMPLRLYYVANVFRHQEPKAYMRREFTQAGVELVGAGTPQADAELVALAVTALRATGLREFRVRLGAMDLLSALLEPLALGELERERLEAALARKNGAVLAAMLGELPASGGLRQAWAALPTLTGGAEVLARAERVCAVNPAAARSTERLAAIWEMLRALGVADAVTLDLGMARGMAYYTGIVFEIFAQGLGFAIASGGRYDALLAHFGRDLPACGFALGVERVLAALESQGAAAPSLAPDIVAELGRGTELAGRVAEARTAGKRVEWALAEQSRAALLEWARARGARAVWFADGSSGNLE